MNAPGLGRTEIVAKSRSIVPIDDFYGSASRVARVGGGEHLSWPRFSSSSAPVQACGCLPVHYPDWLPDWPCWPIAMVPLTGECDQLGLPFGEYPFCE